MTAVSLQLDLCCPTIVIARPLSELAVHLTHARIPSLYLIARCIKVLALGVFKWHLYDEILLLRNEALIHSLKGRVEAIPNSGREFLPVENTTPSMLTEEDLNWVTVEGNTVTSKCPRLYFKKQDLAGFTQLYPYLLSEAHYYRVDTENAPSWSGPSPKPRELTLSPEVQCPIPNFSSYRTIDASSVVKYFKNFHHAMITSRTSIYALIHSQFVQQLNLDEIADLSCLRPCEN